MIDRLLGGSDDEGEAPPAESGGDELFDEDLGMGDDLGGGLEDDLGFGMDDDGGDIDEIEQRINDFEQEVGSMSSTVTTLKSENAQIGEDVGEMRENVRKLMEIYEMVTRGINPFVDEPGAGGEFEGDAGMSIFGDDDDAEDEEDDLDDAIAEADADEFFDDDLDAFDDDFDDEFTDEETTSESGDLSFAELKEEYESGDAAWAEEGEAASTAGENGELDQPTEDDTPDIDDEPPLEDQNATPEPDPSTQPEPRVPTPRPQPIGQSEGSSTAVGEKPYLRDLPTGYAADIIVLRWMEFLTDRVDVDAAADTIAYYEAIGWVSETAASGLLTYLAGLGADTSDVDPRPTSALSIDEHTQSLQYIHRLATLSPKPVVLTDGEAIVDDLVTTDTSFAATAVPQVDGLMDALARTDGGPPANGLPERWVPANQRLHRGDRS